MILGAMIPPLSSHDQFENTLHRNEEDLEIKMNDIARVKLRLAKPIFTDSYSKNRITGSVILIDEATNNTVASGMII
jgi:sulfate adenylyltransferase subunit 1